MNRNERPVKPSRRYDAPSRRAAAARTRNRVVDVAERHFLRDGFSATTVAAIARDAGVSVDTIYKSFDGKAGLVRALFERALAGRAPIPAEERSDALHARGLSGRQIIEAWGEFVAELAPQGAPIVLLLRDAAAVDVNARQLLEELDADRHRRMTLNARRLRDGGHLRAGVSVAMAADVLWSYSSTELYDLLVVRRRWSSKRYGQFVADAMIAALI